ncbi:MAG: hypothetical protein AAFZ63_08085 [Bacteroidota bacterium]
MLSLAFSCKNASNIDSLQISYEVPVGGKAKTGYLHLTKGTDTLSSTKVPLRNNISRSIRLDNFPDTDIEEVPWDWTCNLMITDSTLFDFTGETAILFELMNEAAIKKFSPKYFNLIIGEEALYHAIDDAKYQSCEDLYLASLLAIQHIPTAVNSDSLTYRLIGLDSCQIAETIQVSSMARNLEGNQIIMTPSACKVMDLDNNILSNKPYFLIEFDQVKNIVVPQKITLLNKGALFYWIDI